MSKKYLITEKTLKEIISIQEGLEDYNLSQVNAARELKYAIEDIEAKELTVLDEFSRDGARVMTVSYYEAGGGQ